MEFTNDSPLGRQFREAGYLVAGRFEADHDLARLLAQSLANDTDQMIEIVYHEKPEPWMAPNTHTSVISPMPIEPLTERIL